MITVFSPSWDKNRTVEKTLSKLNTAPKQIANSAEAFQDNVLEWSVNEFCGPYGTLSELESYFGDNIIEIVLTNGKLVVQKNQEGNWKQWVHPHVN